jgi:hypothetical protein
MNKALAEVAQALNLKNAFAHTRERQLKEFNKINKEIQALKYES